MGQAKRYIIAIVDDDRAPLDKFCEKLTAAGSTCNVRRNEVGPRLVRVTAADRATEVEGQFRNNG